MSENAQKPRIRFKGFSAAWEQRKLGDLFNYYRPDNYIVKSDKYVENAPTPVLTANKGFILGYTSENRTFSQPCIIFDDFTLDNKFVDFPFMVKSSAMKILVLKDEKFDDLIFCYELLNSTKIEVLGHARHYISVVQPTVVNIPRYEEQRRISELFQQISNLITLHQRKYDKLVAVKKSLLEKMFPADGETVPKIRFKGFSDAWEQRKLNELVSYHSSNLTATDSCESGEYDLYDANTIIGKTNVEPISTDYITIIKDGAGVGRIRKMPAKTMFIGTMGGITAEKSNLSFIYSLLIRFNLGNEFTGSTIPHIYFKDYGNNEYYVPSIREQQVIGRYFDKIDNLITLHQRQLEKLKNIKSALLEKMFV